MARFTPYAERYAANMSRVATEAMTVAEWHDYAAYCSLRAEGRRAEAFASLQRFLSSTARWDMQERRRFVVWVLARSGEGDFVPFPLSASLVKPTLQEWVLSSPTDPEPLLLLGNVESSRKAWNLAQLNPRVALRFAARALAHLEMSAHELPAGWVGDLAEDRILLAEVLSALEVTPESPEREPLLKRAKDLHAELAAWLTRESA